MEGFETFDDPLGWDRLFEYRLRFMIITKGGDVDRRGFIYLCLSSLGPVLSDLAKSAGSDTLVVRIERKGE